MACCSSNEELLKEDLKRTKELTISLLKEKKALLVSLEKERKAARKRDKEWKGLLKQVGAHGSESASLESIDETPKSSVSNTHQDCRKENATLLKRISTSEQDVRKARGEIRELENQKLVLEAEVMRLAETLNKAAVDGVGEGLLQEQLHVYEEDFKKEKNEKKAAEGRVVTLEETVRDYQDLVSTLTRELDMYKNAYEREKREKEFALFHAAGSPALAASVSQSQPELSTTESPRTPSPSHPLQVVYPVVGTTNKELNKRRKQQLGKVGVFARNSNTTDGIFQGTES